ncbi:MAG TPA: adenylate/guanylate cyclase domain-containing protein [Chthoniobacterales bacterium]|jgi:TolB-like protein/class 3 adenylate cyclase/Flp pilus assembly protein TadD|nr:adenylate/guanylate cyclase domain-containing protein [Chthoniobacterales bacterium]
MSAELPPDLELEIAHLLLIDVVGYSKLLVNDQVESLRQLNRIVRSTDCFRAAEAKDKLIRLPTGDGMALLFFENLEQPARCALEVARALKNHPEIQVRMGIHSGPVNQIPDVNDRINIAGAGINVAQRVLDCGDAGHILLSKHVADDLGEYRHWQPYLKDLGECEVKHGLRLHLFNLCKDDLGNPQAPEKLKRRKRWKETGPVHPVASPRWPRWAPIAALLLSGCALAISFTIFLRHRAIRSEPFADPTSAIPYKSIAVLPFENLSDDKQNAYFADGVQDEILTNLAKVADLKVISRTSVMQYRNIIQRNLREIGKTLGVAHILEGAVQRAGGRVRVSAQLIDARTDAHLWGERYDRDLADVFAIENELAEQIVGQLKSKLSPQEKAAIEEKPTADLVAYDLYTRAKLLIERSVFNEPRKNLYEAVSLLDQAVAHDPNFVLAYYQLAHAHDQIYLRSFEHTPGRLALANAAIETVRRLKPDSSEGHLALAKHRYWGYRDYDGARREIDLARRSLPNDATSYLLTGYLDRRQARWEESIRNMERAVELDPQNFFVLQQLALTYNMLRRYADATAALDKAISVAPQDEQLRTQRAGIDFDWRGDSKPLHDALDRIINRNPKVAPAFTNDRFLLAMWEHDPAAAAEASKLITSEATYDWGVASFPRSWCEGMIARMRGDAAAAQAAFTRAREDTEKLTRDQSEDIADLAALGMIEAALGRKKEAVRDARRALQLLPVSKDAVDGVAMMETAAVIYAWVGKTDDAIDELTATAKLPGYLSYGQLKHDPLWDPLRRDPRFDKIVASLAPK